MKKYVPNLPLVLGRLIFVSGKGEFPLKNFVYFIYPYKAMLCMQTVGYNNGGFRAIKGI